MYLLGNLSYQWAERRSIYPQITEQGLDIPLLCNEHLRMNTLRVGTELADTQKQKIISTI
jgi:hypothetical protein